MKTGKYFGRKSVALARLLFAASVAGAAIACAVPARAADCNLDELALVGKWSIASDGGAFEQMEFSTAGGQNSFNSWLGERPEISGGTWALENCTLRIVNPRNPGHPYVFSARIATGLRLELWEQGAPAARYRRLENSQ